jgi:FKBP-type peptidyl-prolyl cis-trans isomerase (trigger factor)
MAEQRVHERLVLDAVAKHLSLRLDEEKFEQFLAMAASQQNVSSMALRQRLTEDGRLEGLRAQLLRDQTLQHLLGETDDDEDESTEASAAEGVEDAETENTETENTGTENDD